MEVKPGYKQTEVGVIPEEWALKRLRDVAQIRSGIAKNENSSVADPMLVHYLRVANVQDGFLDLSEMSQLKISRSDLQRFSVLPGDVLMNEGGDRDKLGRGSIWRGEFQPCVHQNHIFVVRCGREVVPEYLTLWSAGTTARKYFLLAGKQTTNLASINKTSLGELPVVLPEDREQHAIAQALSDVDGLLGGLDRLITKKRALKQAAMQQLLTGQTRLPGFHADWKIVPLRDAGEIASAGVDKKCRPDEVPVRLVNYLDVYRKDFIYSRDLNHWVTAPSPQAQRCAVQRGDVFFTPTSETREDIGASAVAMEDIPDAAYSYHVARLRLHEPWDFCFRTYVFKTRFFLDQARTLCDGNGTRYVISQGKFRDMTVQVPPIPEQTAIAEVLSDMDAELLALERRREKTRALKQAMMQELLTGRTRLV